MHLSDNVTPVPSHVANRKIVDAVTLDFDRIPIIDLRPALEGDAEAFAKTADQIREVCREVGFFYVKNHGIEEPVLDAALQTTADFFHLPESVKLQYDIGKIRRHRGYVPLGALSADPEQIDHQQGYEVGPELPADDPDHLAGNCLYGPNVWPAEVAGFETAVYTYFEEAFELGRTLFKLFASALDLPLDYFEPHLTRPTAQLRLIYYPALDPSLPAEKATGIGAHTDYECFTILRQTDPGLQVQNRARQWIEAPPIPGTFVINIGDMFQRWTNDLFVSTPHRVISNTGRERYSFPLFFGLNHATVVRCLDACASTENPPRYPPTHFGHWIETMHTYAYKYRWHERGKIPNPELV
jgi:isopenicillin N synthase-like dioxygenase